MNLEFLDVQAGFRKGRGTRDQIANILWIMEKAGVPEIHLFLLYWLCQAFDCVDHNKLWKILREMGITDHLTCLFRNLYAGQEATVRTGHGTTDSFQIGKGLCQGCWHHPYGRKWRGTKKPLDDSERGEWKSLLKAQHSENEDHGIRSHHFMGNRWENRGNSVRLYFEGLQNHCSHEIKRHSLLGRKVMTKLDSIFKSRDITLPKKVHLVKAMVFPVVMYGCESWTVKKAERRGIDTFELWCWRRLLRVPWTARRSK